MDRREVPTFESIFVDGRIAVGSTGDMMTAVYDGSRLAEANPSHPISGKMPYEHAALHITPDLLNRLARRTGPDVVKIVLHPNSVDWIFGSHTIVVKELIDHPDDYDFDDESEDQSDYFYPDYREMISRAIREIDELREPVAFDDSAAFCVTLGINALRILLQISTVLGEPSRRVNGSWREGEAATFFISGGTPSFHVVRYASVSGLLDSSILTIVGSRTSKSLGVSTTEILPEFVLKPDCDRPTSIWRYGEDDDDFTDDEIVDDDDEVADLEDED